MKTSSTGPAARTRSHGFLILAAALAVTLAILFYKSFIPGHVIYSNDAPLGLMSAHQGDMPTGFKGTWLDLNWVGDQYIAGPPDFSLLCRTFLGAVGYSSFMCPIAMLLLGICAWVFFRELRLAPLACILGGLAAGLNGEFFSTACWGIVAQPVNFAANFLALAALANPNPRRPWIRYCLAGFAVGWGVMEGFDIGAIFSLFTAAFVMFQAWNTENGPSLVKKLSRGALRTAVVAICAGIIATQAINSLIGTQIQGVVGTGQDEKTKQEHWDNATGWSLPKLETLQTFMPGFFGYRMASWPMYGDSDGFTPASYWGSIGGSPQVDEIRDAAEGSEPQISAEATKALKSGQIPFRFSGGGLYDGVLVILVALWAVFQSFRSKGSPYTLLQRRSIWFWLAMSIISLLLAYGRYAPFYKLFYALPYASTIRVPAKFMHVFSWAMVILFAYGAHGLSRAYLENPLLAAKGASERLKALWAKAPAFDRNWIRGSVAAVGVSLLAGLVYVSSMGNMQRFLELDGFTETEAPLVAHHSAEALGWFVLLLILAVGIVSLISIGLFAGQRARLGGILLGSLLVLDLGFANRPWIVYFDYPYKYESNAVIDLLRDKPYEHRVTLAPFQGTDPVFYPYYHYEWKQQIFPYYNIQNLDTIQEPRASVEKTKYTGALFPKTQQPFTAFMREWMLTDARYIFAPSGFAQQINPQIDPTKPTFKVLAKFALKPRKNEFSPTIQDYAAETNSTGPIELAEYTDALPRASLYSNWRVITNEDEVLRLLPSPEFDPHHVVLVSTEIPSPPPAGSNDSPGSVGINDNYRPKRVELEADVKAPSVLLLNDKFNPNWKVTVDGKQEPLLRCNFLMRGVYLPHTGKHTIVFSFEPSIKGLFISVAADAIAIALLLFIVVAPGGEPEPEPAPAVSAPPAEAIENARKEEAKSQGKKKPGK